MLPIVFLTGTNYNQLKSTTGHHMRVAYVFILCVLSFGMNAQNDTSVFTKQKEIANNEYVFLVPEQWKNIPQMDISSKDRKFEFSSVGLPKEFNHVPVTATLTLRKFDCNNISKAVDYTITEITSFPDRVTQPGHNYETDTLKILSGENATLFSSRFYRRTKITNYSRYDLIAYSKKRKAAYMFTITFQYLDPTYAFETDNKLRQYALRFFGNILLR